MRVPENLCLVRRHVLSVRTTEHNSTVYFPNCNVPIYYVRPRSATVSAGPDPELRRHLGLVEIGNVGTYPLAHELARRMAYYQLY